MPVRPFYLPLAALFAIVMIASAAAADEPGDKPATPPPQAAAPPTKEECVAANENAQDLQSAGKLRDAAARLRTCMD
ncbi:MAG: hypothetical protein ACREJ3_12785, partial [Polyangiaceae bacterium]